MIGRDEGSVLVEALAATAIVAMILLATFQATADSAVRRRTLEQRRDALLIAQSELATAGSVLPLVAGAVEGREGDDIWRVEMQPCGAGQGAGAAGRLFCVTVAVRAAVDGAPLASLASRRLAPLN